MQYDEMIDTLVRRLPVGAEQARTVLGGVVRALGETARRGEMRDLRSQLPGELKDIEAEIREPDRSVDEFSTRVGDLTGIDDVDEARRFAGTALGVISEAVSAGQLSQLLATLPHGYAELLSAPAGRDGS
ncbi:MAG: DUF2267 domain-containing protein [Pseudonocardiaceae bacterium]|nr:DUF2267 domain-containing protein [Pseudonocardiaceae bacterium]